MNPNTDQTVPPESPRFYLEAAKNSETYWEELAILDFTEEVLRRMDESGVNRSTLAARLDVDPAYVSKLVGGSNNFTLRTMVRICRALESELRFHLQPSGSRAVWIDYDLIPETVRFADVVFTPASTFPLDRFEFVESSPSTTMTYAARTIAA
jgi:DNA-binding Xre family transcriptional regulator